MFDIDAALSAAAGARPLAQSYGALASRVQQGVLCVCPANDRGLTTALNWAAHAHVRGMRPVIGLDGPLPAATAAAPSSAVAFFQLPTAAEAIDAVARHKPGLVLADIQLADGSSGIDAVKEILKNIDVPVIFITAFPERLLTGERPEPTFLITKPFQPETVKAAISQALFFHPSRHKEAA